MSSYSKIPHGQVKRGLVVYDPRGSSVIVTEKGTPLVPAFYVYHPKKTIFEQKNLPMTKYAPDNPDQDSYDGWTKTIPNGLWVAPTWWNDLLPYPPGWIKIGTPQPVWIFTDLKSDRVLLVHALSQGDAQNIARKHGWFKQHKGWVSR